MNKLIDNTLNPNGYLEFTIEGSIVVKGIHFQMIASIENQQRGRTTFSRPLDAVVPDFVIGKSFIEEKFLNKEFSVNPALLKSFDDSDSDIVGEIYEKHNYFNYGLALITGETYNALKDWWTINKTKFSDKEKLDWFDYVKISEELTITVKMVN